jgi:hypothetical protein
MDFVRSYLIFIFMMISLITEISQAGFYVNGQTAYHQIKVSEPGTSGTISASPGTTLNVGFDYFGKDRFVFGANYAMKTVSFLNDEESGRMIVQQPPTVYAAEAKLGFKFGRTTYLGLLYGQRDTIYVDAVTVSGISVNVATLPEMGLELGSKAVSASSVDVYIAVKAYFISQKKLGALNLESGSALSSGIRIFCFSNKWLELNSMIHFSTLNFSDSKQTNVTAVAGLGFAF